MRTLWKYGNWLMAAVMGMGVVLLCAVSLAVARNCVFSADDFLSLAEYQQGCGLLSLLQMAFSHTVSVYFSHAGAYTSYFLGDVNIFVLAEGWLTLSQLMVLGIGLFQIMLILFVLCAVFRSGICRGLGEIGKAGFFVLGVFWMLFDSQPWPEILGWCSGYNAYMLPVTFGLAAAALMIGGRSSGLRGIAGALCGILACGGTLQVTGFTLYLLLVILLIKAFQKRTAAADWVIFAAAVAGTVINLAAPGNYLRRSSVDATGFHPLRAMPYVWEHGTETLVQAMKSGIVLAFLLVVLLLGIRMYSRFTQKTGHMALLILACVLAPYLIAIPVCVGYGGTYFPNRCVWLTTLTVSLAMTTAFFCVGVLLGRWGGVFCGRLVPGAAAVLAVLLLGMGIRALPWNSAVFTTISHLRDGSIANYHQQITDMLSYLETTDESDVVIAQLPAEVPELKGFYLDVDPEAWANQGMAQYYGLASIACQPQP